jgi:hypothetical protein
MGLGEGGVGVTLNREKTLGGEELHSHEVNPTIRPSRDRVGCSASFHPPHLHPASWVWAV